MLCVLPVSYDSPSVLCLSPLILFCFPQSVTCRQPSVFPHLPFPGKLHHIIPVADWAHRPLADIVFPLLDGNAAKERLKQFLIRRITLPLPQSVYLRHIHLGEKGRLSMKISHCPFIIYDCKIFLPKPVCEMLSQKRQKLILRADPASSILRPCLPISANLTKPLYF